MRVSIGGLVQARWSKDILDEAFGSLARRRPDLTNLPRTRAKMETALPGACVEGYDSLISALTLPDPKDRHVLAAAIRSGAQVVVTYNLADFPEEQIAPYGIEAQHPDTFLCHTLELRPANVLAMLDERVKALLRPPMTTDDLLETFLKIGLGQFVATARNLIHGRE